MSDYPLESIGAVIQTIDEGLERLPSYMDLYHKWEQQQWAVQALDFSLDKQQWAADAPDLLRRNRMAGYIGFFAGEIAVTDTLAPFIAAMPRLDQRVFLTTQLADEARHVVFFDRWFREVLGDDPKLIGMQELIVNRPRRPFSTYIFDELLVDIANGLRRQPEDLGLLVDGVTLYHLIIEGALALAGQKRILENYKQLDLFPGFQKGFTDVARDESRHVLFGVRFLHDMVQSDDRFAYRIVNFINQILPSLYESARPEPDMLAYMLQAGQDIDWRQKFYANSFRRKLRAVGIQANIPDPQPTPIPAELMAAVAAH